MRKIKTLLINFMPKKENKHNSEYYTTCYDNELKKTHSVKKAEKYATENYKKSKLKYGSFL